MKYRQSLNLQPLLPQERGKTSKLKEKYVQGKEMDPDDYNYSIGNLKCAQKPCSQLSKHLTALSKGIESTQSFDLI